jgi:hypothetical protein
VQILMCRLQDHVHRRQFRVSATAVSRRTAALTTLALSAAVTGVRHCIRIHRLHSRLPLGVVEGYFTQRSLLPLQ